jgi:hypothetical protein
MTDVYIRLYKVDGKFVFAYEGDSGEPTDEVSPRFDSSEMAEDFLSDLQGSLSLSIFDENGCIIAEPLNSKQ